MFFFIKILSLRIIFFKQFLAYERNSKKDGYQYFDSNFQFSIPSQIHSFGKEFLKKINPENKKIVCLNLWNSHHLSKQNNLDWSHHNFRNSSFENYIKAINYLTDKNFLVIKVGKSNFESKIENNQNFVDYSFKYQNDYLDIAILNNCYAYISNGTGLDHLCFALNKPMLINSSHIHDFFVERNNIVYLLRPYYFNTKEKYLTLREIIYEHDLSFKFKDYEFKKKNITIEDNNEDEILLAVKDLISLINNNFKTNKDLHDLSKKFFEFFMLAKEKHQKDIEYYKELKLKSYYSWSAIKENYNWIK